MAWQLYQGDCLDWFRTQPRVLRNHPAQNGRVGNEFISNSVVRSPRKTRQKGEEQVVTIAELLEARGEIAQLEKLKKRSISEDELMPILHNRRVAVQEFEQELREGYKEKFPKWLNAEDLEALCLFIVTANLFEHYS